MGSFPVETQQSGGGPPPNSVPPGELRFEEQLAAIASAFIDVPGDALDDALALAMERVGAALRADRVSLLSYDQSQLSAKRLFHWSLPGTPDVELFTSTIDARDFPWAMGELERGELLVLKGPEGVPGSAATERALLAQNPGLHVVAPLKIRNELLGSLAVSWIARAGEWTPLLEARVRLVVELVASAMHRRLVELVGAELQRFDALLMGITSELLEMHPDQDGTLSALEALATFEGVDRAYLYQVDGSDIATLTNEWLAAGVPQRVSRTLPVGTFPKVALAMRSREPWVVADSRKLGDDAALERDALTSGGVLSQVIVPLTIDGGLLGALGLDTIGRTRNWSEALLARVQLVGRVFASAMFRRALERDRADRLAFDDLLASISASLISAPRERIGQEIERSLERIREHLGLLRAILFEVNVDAGTFRLSHTVGVPGSFTVGTEYPTAPLGEPLVRTLRNGVELTRATDLPEGDLRRGWERNGISIAGAVVVARAGPRHVVLGLHGRDERTLAGIFVERARRLEEVISSALARRDAEEQVARAFDEVARLKAQIERERDYLREEIRIDHDVGSMIAESAAIRRVLETVDAVASTNATVLIRGETGVGKELVARAIHARSLRADQALVKVNCASIPRELFESEFFGHLKGSFTGATRDRAGRFELADKGTLFLDEVGEIPTELQAKLLRVLQEGEIERVGDDRVRKVDVRIIAATNRDLERDVEAGTFRRDLYYRLSVFPVDVPPLRERVADILPLARSFLAKFAKQMGRSGLVLEKSHEDLLLAYGWPGNVRELAHTIERAVILSQRPPLRLDLPAAITRPSAPSARAGAEPGDIQTDAELRDLERRNLIAAMTRADGRVAGRGGAAELLGISPSTLRDRLRAFGIEVPKRGRS